MDDIFAISNNYNLKELEDAKDKVRKYIEENGDDPQLNDTLIVLEIFIDENLNFKHDDHYIKLIKYCEMAAPTLARLSVTDEWDYYDLRILCRVVDYAKTYKESIEIAQRALKRLEDFSDKERYYHIKLAFHINILLRLTRAKYSETDGMDSTRSHSRILKLFVEHYQQIERVCSGGKFPMYLAMAKVRYGVFINFDTFSQEGLDLFKKIGDHEGYEYWKKEIEEHKKFQNLAMNVGHFSDIVAKNIKEARINYGISSQKASKALGYVSDMVCAMERCQKEIKIVDVFKLAHLYGISTDDFFYGIEMPSVELSYVLDYKRTNIQKMINIAKRFSEKEMMAAIDMLRAMQNTSQQN